VHPAGQNWHLHCTLAHRSVIYLIFLALPGHAERPTYMELLEAYCSISASFVAKLRSFEKKVNKKIQLKFVRTQDAGVKLVKNKVIVMLMFYSWRAITAIGVLFHYLLCHDVMKHRQHREQRFTAHNEPWSHK
jgi:hypothetical protein